MSPPTGRLAPRFLAHVAATGPLREGDGVVVALSGGADSVVLLHLLRFSPGLPGLSLSAVHVDHGMRDGSGRDAQWVRGLCHAWGVPLQVQRLDPPPTTEAAARERRYAVLGEARVRQGAHWILTAHHADDQAETVLFRAVRGTGVSGLRGIRGRRNPGVWRPLLPFSRDELRAYAASHLLGWREDPTNRAPLGRNVLRHRILPELQRSLSPGVRGALVGLARRASSDEAAWRSLEPPLLDAAGLRDEDDGYSVERAALAALHPGVRGRLLRALARRLGASVSEAGTRRAVEFTRAGRSGSLVPLGTNVTLRRELDRLYVVRVSDIAPDQEATLGGRGEGITEARIGGVTYRIRWRVGGRPGGDGEWSAPLAGLALPLTVRGWHPGDRVRLPYGSKKVKKVLLEARIPSLRRHTVPVVADATGAVLWMPGVVMAVGAVPEGTERVLIIGITDAQPH